jgi:hypothetical protein
VLKLLGVCLGLLASVGVAGRARCAPITIEKQGAFSVGGKIIGDTSRAPA